MKNRDEDAVKDKKPDSCGCAIGARVMTVAFIISAAFYGWQFHENAIGLAAMVFRTLMITFFSAGAGKLAGITIYRLKKAINTN